MAAIPLGYATAITENVSVSKEQNLQNVSIQLNPNKTTCIKGTVRSSLSDKPIEDALVAIFTEKKGGLAFTNGQGEYKVCGLDSGTYEIALGAAGFQILDGMALRFWQMGRS